MPDLRSFIKVEIQRGAMAAGWEASIESLSNGTHAQTWAGDVLCSKPGRPATVVFEVGLNPQEDEVMRACQAIYEKSGLRPIWLTSHFNPSQKPQKSRPCFALKFGPLRGAPLQADVLIDGRSIPIAKFAQGALSGFLTWHEVEGTGVAGLRLVRSKCPNKACRQHIFLAYGGQNEFGSFMPLEHVLDIIGFREGVQRLQELCPAVAQTPTSGAYGFRVPCPACSREIGYGSTPVQDPDGLLNIPIGVYVSKPAGWDDYDAVGPHAAWHWGPQESWPNWARPGEPHARAYEMLAASMGQRASLMK